MEPRPTHHDFAHTLLPSEAHHDPEALWEALCGPDPDGWLKAQWSMAGGRARDVTPRLIEACVVGEQGWEVLIIEPPPPEAATEAWWIALVRRPGDARDVGCFVLERAEDGQGRLIEWRPGPIALRGPTLSPSRGAFLTQLKGALIDRPVPAFAGLHALTTPSGRHFALPAAEETEPRLAGRALVWLAALTVALSVLIVAFGLML